MIDTKLIMVEGIVGSGKSTTADHIAKLISDAGKKVNLYHEYAREYPLEMYISNLLQNNYGKQFDVQSVIRKILANDPEPDGRRPIGDRIARLIEVCEQRQHTGRHVESDGIAGTATSARIIGHHHGR